MYLIKGRAEYDGKMCESTLLSHDPDYKPAGFEVTEVRELEVGEKYNCQGCEDLVSYPHKCTFSSWL